MSKERLEEIKQTINHPNYTEHNGQEEIYFMVSDNDFNWLIEQAERVQELETTVDFYQSALRDADRRVQELENHIDHLYDNNVHLKGDYRLQEQNKRYRKVIESMTSEIKYALYSNKSKDVKEHYLKNAERYGNEALEGEE